MQNKIVAQDKLSESKQLVVVVADDWDRDHGWMYWFHRNDLPGQWNQVGLPKKVMLGKNGLARDRSFDIPGVHADLKQEGDYKSPVGVFKIGFSFGYADPSEVLFTQMPYLMADPSLKCVDDPKSKYYNKIISTAITADKDWESAEDLKRPDHLYKWGVIIEQNWDNPIPGAGSCVYFHLWRANGKPTAGCTAMDEAAMMDFLKWLQPDKNPVMVLFPFVEYNKFRDEYLLPPLEIPR